jgi:hypothetical protein
MCDQCDLFFLPVGVGPDRAWRQQLDRLRTAITDDVLAIVGGQMPADGTAPPTCARITATCTLCGQLFLLERGMCSAFGDQWHPLHGN